MAPTVVRDGEFTFVVHPREPPYEPPHVHVEFGDEEVRINLEDGTFLEAPPAGKRRALLRAFQRHIWEIRACWKRVRPR
jgi:hypothetical protein